MSDHKVVSQEEWTAARKAHLVPQLFAGRSQLIVYHFMYAD
jgi:predicted dithiol-disulfide oxidoreductase (DUF899 family)